MKPEYIRTNTYEPVSQYTKSIVPYVYVCYVWGFKQFFANKLLCQPETYKIGTRGEKKGIG